MAKKESVLSMLSSMSDEPDDELARVLHHARTALMIHPVAARAAFRALVAEGKRFAETDAGLVWSERLSGSELIRRGRPVFDVATAGILSDERDRVLPSQYIDALSYAVSLVDLESALSRAVEPADTDRDEDQ